VAGIRSDGRRQVWSNAAPQRLSHLDDPQPPLTSGRFRASHLLRRRRVSYSPEFELLNCKACLTWLP